MADVAAAARARSDPRPAHCPAGSVGPPAHCRPPDPLPARTRCRWDRNRRAVVDALRASLESICGRRGLACALEVKNEAAAVELHPEVAAGLAEAAGRAAPLLARLLLRKEARREQLQAAKSTMQGACAAMPEGGMLPACQGVQVAAAAEAAAQHEQQQQQGVGNASASAAAAEVAAQAANVTLPLFTDLVSGAGHGERGGRPLHLRPTHLRPSVAPLLCPAGRRAPPPPPRPPAP